MKVQVQGPNGIMEIELAASVNTLAVAGQMPNAAPGYNALKILAGWPHGSTAGLGGVDWRSGCNVHRGENYIIGPSYDDFLASEDVCKQLLGIGGLCTPSAPRGSWLIPVEFEVPLFDPAGVPGFGSVEVQLTMPLPSRLYALEVMATRGTPRVVVPPEEPPVNPCPCDSVCNCCSSFDALKVGGWTSRQIENSYPQSGRDSSLRFVTGAGVATTAALEFRDQFAPSCLYSSERLLNGQNFLPPWVQNCELERGNDDLRFSLRNFDPDFQAAVTLVFHMAYGKFHAEKFAAACGCAA